MKPKSRKQHAEHVDDWLRRGPRDLTSAQLAAGLGGAVLAIWRRSSVTLSDITLVVIFERALITLSPAAPILASIRIEERGPDSTTTIASAPQFTPEEVRDAYRSLLIELITIIGALTADILTEALYQELGSNPLAATSTGPVPANGPLATSIPKREKND